MNHKVHSVGGIHGTEEASKHAMLQCFRTTLVKHPDDLRGRRRANLARTLFEDKPWYYKLQVWCDEFYEWVFGENVVAKRYCRDFWIFIDVLCFSYISLMLFNFLLMSLNLPTHVHWF